MKRKTLINYVDVCCDRFSCCLNLSLPLCDICFLYLFFSLSPFTSRFSLFFSTSCFFPSPLASFPPYPSPSSLLSPSSSFFSHLRTATPLPHHHHSPITFPSPCLSQFPSLLHPLPPPKVVSHSYRYQADYWVRKCLEEQS